MDNIILYQSESGSLIFEVNLEKDTVWLNRAQLSELFDRDIKTIGKHVNNIFKEGELDKESVVAHFATTAKDGKTYQVENYNLDVIISVGYRVKSLKGTHFRIWATEKLKTHLVKGYTLNQQRFQSNATELNAALELIKKAAQSPELNVESGKGLVEITSRYTQTFLWLQAYDEGLLNEPKGQIGGKLPSEAQAEAGLAELKHNLMKKGEATELFAKPRGDGLSSILGNLQQTVFGEPAYPTIESKAAHLLYFMVKNHPFTDGKNHNGALCL